MGCCENKNGISNKDLTERFKNCILYNNLYMLKQYYKVCKNKDPNFDINAISIVIDENLTVSPLGYSLLLGHQQVFSLILKELDGDFLLMENIFERASTTGLSVICLNNYISLLPIYLPYFMSTKTNQMKSNVTTKTLALDLDKSIGSIQCSSLTPIQLACEGGFISIVNFFLSYNSSLTLIPHEFDIHYIEPVSGNNCALIGCKTNNFNMIKFLHSQCKADFSVINNFNENALNILAIGSKDNRIETLKCAQYLIEKIGIDPCFNYQETLLLLEEDKTVAYIEKLLETKGLLMKKIDLVEKEKIVCLKRTTCKVYDTGNRFTFTRMFPELLKSSTTSSFIGNVGQSTPDTYKQEDNKLDI